MKKTVIILSFALLAVSITNAGEIPMVFKSLRAMGMGNAFNAFCNDPATLMYNPGGLSFVSNLRISTKPLMLGTNGEVGDLVSSLISGDLAGYFGGQEVLDEISDFEFFGGTKEWDELSQNAKDEILKMRTLGLSASIFNPTVIIPTDSFLGSVGVGIFMAGDLNAMFDMGMFVPNFTISGAIDTIFVIGVAQKINKYWQDLPGTLSVGLSINSLVNRIKFDGFLSIMSIDEEAEEAIKKIGTGSGLNLGAIYQLPEKENLNFALVLADIGGTTINWDKGSPTKIDGRINMGVAWRPIRFYYWPGKFLRPDEQLVMTADLNGFLSGGDLFKKISLGVEYKLPIVTLRTGFNQGWFTYGLRIMSFFEYTYFQEEVGSFAGAQPAKRHYYNISIGF